MKRLLKLIGVLLLLAGLVFLGCLWFYRDIPASDLEAQYASYPSRFVEVDGVRYHVRQEGQGTDVLLLHASFGNLFMWDEWVAALSSQHRITRIDLISHGLTGAGAQENYSNDELAASLSGLVEAIGLDNFHLVGTSIGGTLAFTYAAENLDQVRSLTLINSAGLLHKNVNPNAVATSIPLKIRLFSHITPRHIIDDMITNIIGVEEQATPAVLQTYYDMIMREGNRQSILSGMANYQSRDPSPWLKKIVAPTFVIWSENSVLPAEEADEFLKLLENAPTQIMLVEGGGHALPISHPIISSQATAEFWRLVDDAIASGESIQNNFALPHIPVE